MTITSRQYSDLINYFSVFNASNHIISLALTANSSVGFIPESPATTVDQTWDILDTVNNTASTIHAQNVVVVGDNFSVNSSFAATNDTLVVNRTVSVLTRPRSSTEIPIWLIPCYSIILIFAIVGNILVASTLFQNRRMRTITNVFLANLAISDMLLGVLCMPITLVGTYLRHFIFGEFVCKFIQFAQAASVAVSSWTLVAISCERYYAICHPLRSRTWQTINHAYKIIGCIWFGSIICMAPIAIFSHLIPTSRQGLRKCREQWPNEDYERFYTIFLDLVLLVLPLGILCIAYILITRTLYMGIKDEKALIFGSKNHNVVNSGGGGSSSVPAGDVRSYTQVQTDVKSTANVFNLNMSFRYHTRKGGARSAVVSSGNNAADDTLQIVQSLSSSGNGKEANIFTNADHNIKCLTPATSYPRILCNNTTATQPEMEILFKDARDHENSKQYKQQQNDKRHSISVSSSFQQQQHQQQPQVQQPCYDDIKQINSTTIPLTVTPPNVNALNNKCTIVAKTPDGRRQQLSCMRSASFKSFNRNSSRTSAESDDTISSSCHSLNAAPTTRLQRQMKQHHQLTAASTSQRYQEIRQPQPQSQYQQCNQQTDPAEKRKLHSTPSMRITESALRRSNLEKNLESKKRVVKMLFVLVLEFFICWTPLYVINTVTMFIGPAIYEYVDYTTIGFFQLLAYSSSCCNPITYCFMNASFRRAFVDTFRGIHLNGGTFWHKSSKTATNLSLAGNSIAMGNSCTVVTANTVLDSPRL